MRAKPLILMVALALELGQSSLLGASEPNAIPIAFRAALGGFLGPCYTVELRGNTLHYSRTNAPSPEVVEITPTTKEWSAFRDSLDRLGVWQWRTNYADTGYYDGTEWELIIRYSDRVLLTRGSNNFPGRKGKPNNHPQMTKEFKSYTAAVQRLVGGRRFE